MGGLCGDIVYRRVSTRLEFWHKNLTFRTGFRLARTIP